MPCRRSSANPSCVHTCTHVKTAVIDAWCWAPLDLEPQGGASVPVSFWGGRKSFESLQTRECLSQTLDENTENTETGLQPAGRSHSSEARHQSRNTYTTTDMHVIYTPTLSVLGWSERGCWGRFHFGSAPCRTHHWRQQIQSKERQRIRSQQHPQVTCYEKRASWSQHKKSMQNGNNLTTLAPPASGIVTNHREPALPLFLFHTAPALDNSKRTLESLDTRKLSKSDPQAVGPRDKHSMPCILFFCARQHVENNNLNACDPQQQIAYSQTFLVVQN